jgi:hypothetical protein
MSRILKPALIVTALLLLGVTAYVRLDRPNIKVRQENAALMIDVQTLGEYPTTVSHIRLAERSSGNVVFELMPDGKVPQIRGFNLGLGDNPVDLVNADYGAYRVVTPRIGKTFVLMPGHEYELTIWGTGLLPSTVTLQPVRRDGSPRSTSTATGPA